MKSFLMVIILSVLGIANSPESQFEKANKSYLSGNYKSAIEQYENVLGTGVESPQLYYNLGNAYFRVGKPANAILNYERAIKLDPGYADAIHNRTYVESQLPEQIVPITPFILLEWWKLLSMSATQKMWAFVSAGVFFVLLVLFSGIVWFKGREFTRYLFYSSIFVALIFTLSVGLFAFRYYNDEFVVRGVVTIKGESVRALPNPEAKETFKSVEGARILIVDEVGEWKQIKLLDGRIGWIEKIYIELL